MIREAWRKWLTDHETRGVYDEHPKRVTDLCKEGSAVEKFETLSKSKNVVQRINSPPSKTEIPIYDITKLFLS